MPVRTQLADSPFTADDHDLLSRLRAGDRDAYAQLYARTAPILIRYATDRLPVADQYSAADVVHDAFCTALAHPKLITTGPLVAMLRLTTHAVSRHLRGCRHETPTAAVSGEGLCVPTGPVLVARTIAVTTRPGFGAAFGTLTALQRQAIELHYLDDYPRDRAAQEMGLDIAEFRDVERRALCRLRDAYTA